MVAVCRRLYRLDKRNTSFHDHLQINDLIHKYVIVMINFTFVHRIDSMSIRGGLKSTILRPYCAETSKIHCSGLGRPIFNMRIDGDSSAAFHYEYRLRGHVS